MNLKNFCLVLLLVALVVFFAVFCIRNTISDKKGKVHVEQEQRTEDDFSLQEKLNIEENTIKTETKAVDMIPKLSSPATPDIKKKQKTVIKSTPQEESKTTDKTESVQNSEDIIVPAQKNISVYRDENSKDIVITTEYKMESPAKYSFK